ncbi:hypothetical protein KDA_33150 [Dictyobacter alpinus]|uniref:Uncharacterized protein n=1 Tax=Dictyobacter alpinus TaxID=2014873 RepID=A0A402B8Y0_9CHLR|nr:hypothetical protein [Dictyobacter alpinus]GCE27831.1 hypothetical protein KDA_33150 [Dictyobacter alpinus]
MAELKVHDIVVHLNDIHELFVLPQQDPFSAQVRFLSGIDVIKSQVKPQMLRQADRTRIVIVLPAKCNEADLVGKIKSALRRYCEFKIWQNHEASTTLKQDSLRALVVGTLFMGIGLFLLSYLEVLPVFLSTFLNDGFNVAFWVILWRPVDFLLFDLTTTLRENRIYKHIAQMDVVVRFE